MASFVFGIVIIFTLYFVPHPCEGRIWIVSPPDGTMLTFLPGSTGKIQWIFYIGEEFIFCGGEMLYTWNFTSSNGSRRERLARSSYYDYEPQIYNNSLPGIAIEKPATLILKNIDLKNNGTYQFKLSSYLDGARTSQVVVFVAVAPTVIINCSSPITVNEGDDLTCVCRGKGGNPPASVTWYKDCCKVGKTGKEKQALTLSNVTETDIATYKCVVQSHINATDEKSIKLEVRLNNSQTADSKTNIKVDTERSAGTVVVWHIVITLVSGIIIGILVSYTVWYPHRRYWFRNKRPEQHPEQRARQEVDPTYQELDLSKLNTENNDYQSLQMNAASDDAAIYENLN